MDYKYFEEHISKTLGNQKSNIDENLLLTNLGLGESESKTFSWNWIVGLLIGMLLISALYYGYTRFDNNTDTSLSEPTVQNAKAYLDTKNNPINANFVTNKESEERKQIEPNVITKGNDNTESNIISEPYPTPRNTPQIKSILLNDVSNKNQFEVGKVSELTVEADNIDKSYEVSTHPVQSNPNLNQSKIGGMEDNVTSIMTKEYYLPIKEKKLPAIEQNKVTCPFGEKNIWYQFGAEVGVGKLYNRMNTSAGDIAEYLNTRANDEEGLEDLNARLFVTVNPKKLPLGLKVGVGIERYANRLRQTTTYTERDTTLGIISSTVSTTGDTITHIYGDIITETVKITDRQKHYYLYNLNLPIGLTYSYDIGSNTLQLELGAILNLKTWKEGTILSSTNDFDTVSDDDIRTGLGASFYGQINLMRHFKNGYSIYAAPYFKYGNHNFSARVQLDHKYNSAGVKLGVVKTF